MDISECVEMLKKCCTFLEDYRKNGFHQTIITAKDLADKIQIEPVFKSLKRIRCAKRQFDEIAQDEPIVCPKKKLGCRPMYPECVTFLRKTMRVREIVTGNIMHLSHSHGFAQKRNAFRTHETAPLEIEFFNSLLDTALVSLKERFE